MPTLLYCMMTTQFTEKQWNKAIPPAIQATMNAAGIAKNIAHVIFYCSIKYQGIGVQIPTSYKALFTLFVFLNKGYATPPTVNFFEQMRNSSMLKWASRSLSSTPSMMRKPTPNICLPAGTRICENLCLRLFLTWILRKTT